MSKVLVVTVYWWSLTSYSHVVKHQITPEFVVKACVYAWVGSGMPQSLSESMLKKIRYERNLGSNWLF